MGIVSWAVIFSAPKQKSAQDEAQTPHVTARWDSWDSCLWTFTWTLHEKLRDRYNIIRAEREKRVLLQFQSLTTASDVTLMCLQSVVNVQNYPTPFLHIAARGICRSIFSSFYCPLSVNSFVDVCDSTTSGLIITTVPYFYNCRSGGPASSTW